MQTLTFKQLQMLIPLLTSGEGDGLFSILIRGKHGIGKSAVAYQTAAKLGLPVVEQRASQMTEGDLLGLPSKEETEINGISAAKLTPFSWLIRACTEPVVLFLDEIDRATTEVRQGFFQLGDSRQINGWKLHEGTIVIGAVNGGPQGDGQYLVSDMDPAELDRWTVYDVAPDVEDWLEWAKNEGDVHSIILDFVRDNHQHLEFGGVFEPGVVYPTRRSWKRLSVAAKSLLDDEDADSVVLFLLATGFIGTEAAVVFRDFVVNYDRQVSPEQIFIDGDIDKASKMDLVEHCALMEKADAKGLFELEGLDANIAWLYFECAPAEAKLKFIQTIVKNVPLFTAVKDAAQAQGKMEDFLSPLQSIAS